MAIGLRKLVANLSKAPQQERRLIQCSTIVNKDAIKRETIGGKEHIIVSSYTLPDDVVMNGGLYPADEIANSYETLEGTTAPIEHPEDADGNFISAIDPFALNNYYAGAFNRNVTRENGRVHVEKVIDVEVANRTEKGKNLLARINEIETNPKADPIHTSTGIFLNVEMLDKPKVNANGEHYEWIARNMYFDHDAILLDNIGAATPNEGVGMAVNKGKTFKVNKVSVDEKKPIINELEMSHEEIRESLQAALVNAHGQDVHIHRVYSESIIFEKERAGYFSQSYVLSDGEVDLIGDVEAVEKQETFTPKFNQQGEQMKDLMINALKQAGVAVDGLDDAALFEAYNKHMAANAKQDPAPAKAEETQAEVIANAIAKANQPLLDKIESLETKLNEADDSKRDEMAEMVGNSDKYPSITVEDAKGFDLPVLEKMAANCVPAYGVNPALSTNNDADSAPTEMPK